ncbi:hypothetical protein KSP39_PZI015968 [Platanthera zijinensis]|uniref:Outer envelope pore protein 37, chloroplastic n=1 Tax=Platanthera zijinensis TaxID=2320716 RepID=A0AAP0B9Q4_9ASPA
MADVISPNPKPISTPPAPPPSASTVIHDHVESTTGSVRLRPIRRPPLRFTSEFDSEGPFFLHKLSCKFFDNLAKFKFSVQNNINGEFFRPQLGFLTKNLSVLYDFESRNSHLRGSLQLGKNLHVRSAYNLQERLGEVEFITSFTDPSIKLQLSVPVTSVGLPRAALQFPYGEIALEQRENIKEDNEVNKVLSVDGILKCPMLNGVSTLVYNGKNLNLRYLYKDAELTFIPCVDLPSNQASFAFKRRLSLSDKLSYWYHFDSSAWSAVYKHTIGKDLKMKAGYDSMIRLCWASLWVGSEDGKVKSAPMKLKAQMMLQVPRDDVRSCALMFRVKKRWDL